jgi:hypothetical protein
VELWNQIYAGVLNKVHFPRLVLPVSAVLAAAADFAVALPLGPVFMLYYDRCPATRSRQSGMFKRTTPGIAAPASTNTCF